VLRLGIIDFLLVKFSSLCRMTSLRSGISSMITGARTIGSYLMGEASLCRDIGDLC
jgi:hypothetical protein